MSESNSDNKGFWLSGGDAWARGSAPIAIKQAEHDEIERKTEEFIAAGGKIDYRAPGDSSDFKPKIPQAHNHRACSKVRPPTSKQFQILRLVIDAAEDGIFNRTVIRRQLSDADAGNLQSNLAALVKKGYIEGTGTRNQYKIIKPIDA
jgi:hypothetical protein